MAPNDIVSGSAPRTITQGSLQKAKGNAETVKKDQTQNAPEPSSVSETVVQSQSLNNRASGLTRILDGIGQSVRTLEETGNDVSTLTFLLGQASSLAKKALENSGDKTTQDEFNETLNKIDDVVDGSSYRGVNLLKGETLTTYFSEDKQNKLVTQGALLTSDGLGLGDGDFSNAEFIQQSIDETQNALDNIRAFAANIEKDLSYIQTRRDFTEQTISTLQSGVSDLAQTDQAEEEGVTLLALQTAQQLGATSLSLASPSQQSILRLF